MDRDVGGESEVWETLNQETFISEQRLGHPEEVTDLIVHSRFSMTDRDGSDPAVSPAGLECQRHPVPRSLLAGRSKPLWNRTPLKSEALETFNSSSRLVSSWHAGSTLHFCFFGAEPGLLTLLQGQNACLIGELTSAGVPLIEEQHAHLASWEPRTLDVEVWLSSLSV